MDDAWVHGCIKKSQPETDCIVQTVVSILRDAPDVTTVGFADLIQQALDRFDAQHGSCSTTPELSSMRSPSPLLSNSARLSNLRSPVSYQRSARRSTKLRISRAHPKLLQSAEEVQHQLIQLHDPQWTQVTLAVTSGDAPDPDATRLSCPMCDFQQQSTEGLGLFVEHLARHRRTLLGNLQPEAVDALEQRIITNKLNHKRLAQHIDGICAASRPPKRQKT